MYLNKNIYALSQTSHSGKRLPLIHPKFSAQKYGFNSIRHQGSRLWNHIENEHRNNNKLKKNGSQTVPAFYV